MNRSTPSYRVTIGEVVNIGPALAAELRVLAAEHQRDFVGEGRAAIRAWLEQHRAPTSGKQSQERER